MHFIERWIFTLTLAFIIIGYLSGSVLYARIFARLFRKKDIIENSKDHNPGTANAFKYGGFLCGVLTLIFDLAKGFLPVFLYILFRDPTAEPAYGLTLVLAAPVIGHTFPIFFKFKGGKGIAATFGCLLGLLPDWYPVVVLAVFFVLFSTIIRISPHYHRTLVTYGVSLIIMPRIVSASAVWLGFILISAAVFVRMLLSSEEKEKMRFNLLWMR